MKYRLQDLIDLEQFQQLQDRLNEICSLPSAIIDTEGNVLTATAWQGVCAQFHRVHPDCERACRQSDQYILHHLHEANPAVTYRCPHGLVDNAMPIIIEGVHCANLFAGQFFLEPPDMDFFRAQARRYGFDEAAYLAAVRLVPVWSEAQLRSYLCFMKGLIGVITESGLKRLREQAQRQRSEETERRAQTILRTAMDGYWCVDMDGRLLDVNDAYCRMSGYDRDALLRMRISELEANETAPMTAAHIEKVRVAGQDRFETRHRRRDGTVYDVEVSVQYRPEGDGQLISFVRDVSERRDAAEKVRQSEAKWRSYVENAPVGVLVADKAGRLVEANRTAEQMLGYRPGELEGIGFKDLPSTEYAEAGAALFRQVVESGSALGEFPIRRNSGGCMWGSIRAVRIADERYLAVIEDITERRRVEEARRIDQERLRESETRLRLALEAGGMGIWDWDLQTGTIVWSEEHAQLFGLTLAEFDGRYETFASRVHPDDLRGLEEEIARDREEGRASRHEFRVIWADGSVHWIASRGHFLRDASGKPVRMLGVIAEITARKQLEIERRRFFLLAESSTEFIGMCDLELKPLYVNPAGQRMVGLPDLGAACRVTVQDYFFPEDQDFIEKEFFPRVLREGHCDVEIRLRHFQTGAAIWMHYYLFSVHDASGKPVGWATVSRDITERKQAEAERERLQSQLYQAQKMEAVGQLAGGVAHDFNNILAAMMMYFSLLKLSPNADAGMRESLEVLETEAKRAANLVRQLLLFGRRTAIQVKPVRLNGIIQGMLDMLGRLIGESIRIEFDDRGGEVVAEVDPGMIEQVVMNLVVNARDAMPTGGQLSLRISKVDVDEEWVRQHPQARVGRFGCLAVRDTGCGMCEATREHIFEPFFTTKPIGKGTGLGLATVHGIVLRHQGWIEVDSKVSVGTEFRVLLPLQERGEATPAVPEQGPREFRGTETILLVEDEAALRLVMGRFLRSLGYEVLEAVNGREAVKQWSQHRERIRLLLTDMVMPEGMTGLQVVQSCRAERPDLEVIICSGYSAEHSIRAEESHAGIVYLPKPTEPQVLARAVRERLDSRWAGQDPLAGE